MMNYCEYYGHTNCCGDFGNGELLSGLWQWWTVVGFMVMMNFCEDYGDNNYCGDYGNDELLSRLW